MNIEYKTISNQHLAISLCFAFPYQCHLRQSVVRIAFSDRGEIAGVCHSFGFDLGFWLIPKG
jgi:hypothetical protein